MSLQDKLDQNQKDIDKLIEEREKLLKESEERYYRGDRFIGRVTGNEYILAQLPSGWVHICLKTGCHANGVNTTVKSKYDYSRDCPYITKNICSNLRRK